MSEVNSSSNSNAEKAGLEKTVSYLKRYENLSADELMEMLGVLTNDRNFAAMVQSIWKVLVGELEMKLLDDLQHIS